MHTLVAQKVSTPTSSILKLALGLAAKVTGREELAALAGGVSQTSDYAYRLIGVTSGVVQ